MQQTPDQSETLPFLEFSSALSKLAKQIHETRTSDKLQVLNAELSALLKPYAEMQPLEVFTAIKNRGTEFFGQFRNQIKWTDVEQSLNVIANFASNTHKNHIISELGLFARAERLSEARKNNERMGWQSHLQMDLESTQAQWTKQKSEIEKLSWALADLTTKHCWLSTPTQSTPSLWPTPAIPPDPATNGSCLEEITFNIPRILRETIDLAEAIKNYSGLPEDRDKEKQPVPLCFPSAAENIRVRLLEQVNPRKRTLSPYPDYRTDGSCEPSFGTEVQESTLTLPHRTALIGLALVLADISGDNPTSIPSTKRLLPLIIPALWEDLSEVQKNEVGSGVMNRAKTLYGWKDIPVVDIAQIDGFGTAGRQIDLNLWRTIAGPFLPTREENLTTVVAKDKQPSEPSSLTARSLLDEMNMLRSGQPDNDIQERILTPKARDTSRPYETLAEILNNLRWFASEAKKPFPESQIGHSGATTCETENKLTSWLEAAIRATEPWTTCVRNARRESAVRHIPFEAFDSVLNDASDVQKKLLLICTGETSTVFRQSDEVNLETSKIVERLRQLSITYHGSENTPQTPSVTPPKPDSSTSAVHATPVVQSEVAAPENPTSAANTSEYADLVEFCVKKLKGNQKTVLEMIIAGNGQRTVGDLMSEIESVPENWHNYRKTLNKKIKKLGYRLETLDNVAQLKRIPPTNRSKKG